MENQKLRDVEENLQLLIEELAPEEEQVLNLLEELLILFLRFREIEKIPKLKDQALTEAEKVQMHSLYDQYYTLAKNAPEQMLLSAKISALEGLISKLKEKRFNALRLRNQTKQGLRGAKKCLDEFRESVEYHADDRTCSVAVGNAPEELWALVRQYNDCLDLLDIINPSHQRYIYLLHIANELREIWKTQMNSSQIESQEAEADVTSFVDLVIRKVRFIFDKIFRD